MTKVLTFLLQNKMFHVWYRLHKASRSSKCIKLWLKQALIRPSSLYCSTKRMNCLQVVKKSSNHSEVEIRWSKYCKQIIHHHLSITLWTYQNPNSRVAWNSAVCRVLFSNMARTIWTWSDGFGSICGISTSMPSYPGILWLELSVKS